MTFFTHVFAGLGGGIWLVLGFHFAADNCMYEENLDKNGKNVKNVFSYFWKGAGLEGDGLDFFLWLLKGSWKNLIIFSQKSENAGFEHWTWDQVYKNQI